MTVALRKAAADIRRLPGVIGVFDGLHRSQRAVHVHVDRRGGAGPFPSKIEGHPLRVTRCSLPEAQAVDIKDALWQSGGSAPRESTITCILRQGNRLFVLGSGHGMLPYASNNLLALSFDHQQHSAPVNVTIFDGSGGFYRGRLLWGRLAGGSALDYGLMRLTQISDADYDDWHGAVSGFPPYPASADAVRVGDDVWHLSRFANRPNRIMGKVSKLALSTTDITLPDGRVGKYANVIVVRGTNTQRFSERGESGSLIVNSAQRVIGTIVGGTGSESYVLPIKPLIRALAAQNFDLMLREVS